MSHLEQLAHEIASRGVKHVFGIPGSGPSLTLLDALEKRGVSFHLTHFEGAAVLMAGTIGRLSGRSSLAVSVKGPGLSNMVPGLTACALEAFPVISISEAYPPGAPPEMVHKRIDHEKLLFGVAKGVRFLSNAGPSFAELAEWAECEVPGPVHLNIASVSQEDPKPRADFPREEHNSGLSVKALTLLTNSSRPVIIAGTLAVRRRWSEYLNKASIPVFSTAAAKGVVDETLPHAAGVFTGMGGHRVPEQTILGQADLVVGIGLRHNEVLNVKPFDCPGIQIDPLKDKAAFGFRFTEYCPGTFAQLDKLFSVLYGKGWGLSELNACLGNLREFMVGNAFLPGHVYNCIEGHFNHKARLVLDTGNFCIVGEHTWRVPRPEWYVASGQGRYMGVGLPQGIGAAIYDSEVPTVVFTGDGGVGMFVAEVKLAVHNKLPLLIVLLSDSYLGTIRGASLKRRLTQHPVTIQQPSWIHVMDGLGVPSVRVKTVNDLQNTLAYWDMTGPLFLEVPFAPDSYQKMTEGIR